jgi:hypothetical protein
MACLPGKAAQSPEPKQGILGFVYLESGNRMPMKGAEQQGAKGLSTTIYIYEATRLEQVSRVGESPFYTSIRTRLVTTVQSDSTGSFRVGLAPGAYSLFTKQGDRFYANAYDAAGNIALVKVEKGKFSQAKITVNSSASY